MRIIKFKTTEENLNSTKIAKVANINSSLFKGYKGYLFSQDEEDRANDQYTVNVFFDNEGEIIVTEYNSAMLTDACRHFIKLNSHANCKDVDPGFNSDVPGNKRISVKLRFSFE